jgi:electron transport complex protein RnfD
VFDAFVGTVSGCIGETSALLLIIGGLYLLYKKIITWHIPVSFLGTVAILTLLFPNMSGVTNVQFMLYHLFSGGLMLGAIFMATDYATSPVTPMGRIIYGIGCGAITVFIRYFGGYPEGVSFAILIMNFFAWFIDKHTIPTKFGGEKKYAKLIEKFKK